MISVSRYAIIFIRTGPYLKASAGGLLSVVVIASVLSPEAVNLQFVDHPVLLYANSCTSAIDRCRLMSLLKQGVQASEDILEHASYVLDGKGGSLMWHS